MSEDEDSYCRLCAEPTPVTQLISPEDDVGLNSKIATKMLWINIDISTSNTLPNSICFSCFDLLERTWSFLHNVRTAQTKLNDIFLKEKQTEVSTTTEVKTDPECNAKPVNEDWEEFEELKKEVKPEILSPDMQLITVDPNTLIDLGVVKDEVSDEDDYQPDFDHLNSTDSDIPVLHLATKKKKLKKKRKLSYMSNGSDTKLCLLTWNDCVCICGDCDAQCENIMSLRLHSIQIHAHCCIFKCPDCNRVTYSNKAFVNHLRAHKNFLRHCCEYCNERFLSSTLLKTHIKNTHDDLKQLSCQHCGTMFENSEQLDNHLILYSKMHHKHKKEIKLSMNKKLKCEFCEKEFKTHSNLQSHRLVHMDRQRNFACHICGKMFFTKGTLGTHILSHDDNKPFKCEFCPQTFKARGNLQAHLSLHSGMKPFVCEQCGKSFRAKRHLKSHSIVHTDLMPYVCPVCEKTFRFKTRLNLHLRQHTGSKPYKCEYCQRDFTNGSNYKKHMKRKHNIDTSRKKYNVIVSPERLETKK